MVSEEKAAEFVSKYGRVKVVSYNGTDLVFRKPTRAECDQHAVKIDEGGMQKVQADNQLAQLLVVKCGEAEEQPAREAFLLLLEEYPYLCRSAAVGGALSRLTGVVQDEEAKS